MRHLSAVLIASILYFTSLDAAEQHCTLGKLGELPATMSGTTAFIPGTINGTPLRFIVDSGAFFSILTRETVQKLQLHEDPLPFGFTLNGVGGEERGGLIKAKQFSLAGLLDGHVFSDVHFIVSGSAVADADGVIGQNVLRIADTEYDLANGTVRLLKAENCSDLSLAYWHGDKAVAEMRIKKTSPEAPHWISEATINGKKIKVLFDSGAGRSILDGAAAEKVGIRPETEGVQAAGLTSGFGPNTVEIVFARFNTLDLGGEVIKNARLFVGDLSRAGDVDLLLGADFFLSHRIYFSAKQNKLYFTYNGGPVFDLRGERSSSAAQSKLVQPVADIEAEATSPEDKNLSAADLRRRGAASMSRGDLKSAMRDFNRAVGLRPDDAENYYERARGYERSEQLQRALTDLDQALRIKPDYIEALLLRGALHLAQKDQAAAQIDFDRVLRLDAHDSGNALTIGQIYAYADLHVEAIAKFTAWIEIFPKDSKLPTVLNNRCWERAIIGELDLALEDCNLALKKGPRNSKVLDSRAFVYLRRKEYDRSIADYQAVLKLQPQQASSMYGLGLAEYKKGQTAAGEQHMHSAMVLAPNVADFYNHLEITP